MPGSRNWVRIKLVIAGLVFVAGALYPRVTLSTDETIPLTGAIVSSIAMVLLLVLARIMGVKGWRNPRNMLKESPFPLSSGFICAFHFLAMIGMADALGELVQLFVKERILSMPALLGAVMAMTFFSFRTLILPLSENSEKNSTSETTEPHSQ